MTDVKPIPDGFTAITPYLLVKDAAGLIDFLAQAFGAVERLRMPMPQGGIGHAVVEINGAALMLADAAPPDFPANNSLIHLYVEDVDSAYASALHAGATTIAEPADEFYGDRSARVADPFGNQWFIGSHVEDGGTDEVMKRIAAMGES